MPVKAGMLSTKAWLRGPFVRNSHQMSKNLQKRGIDDNSRQLVLTRQDRVLINRSTCFLTSESGIFFFFNFFFFF